ncbi:MAG: NupC/NupG family nucleoside CNT transporter [Deltaproteobacteria bacterium]|nr:NupC/NupG family nucleoside CNT transporter [Deltaproteobacteria bacterium]
MDRVLSATGLLVLIATAWLMSNNRRRVDWRLVAWGVGLQLLFALLVLNPVAGDFFFGPMDRAIKKLLSFSEAGADFVFQSVHPHKVEHSADGRSFATEVFAGRISPTAKTFATWILPSIIFFSALMAVLYHLGVMQFVVRWMAKAMLHTMHTSGAETLSAAGNIFLGQSEAPLLVRPFIGRMTPSELMAVMVGGFANTAGGVLALYVGLLHNVPGIAGHLLISSIISAPASLLIAKVLYPETLPAETVGNLNVEVPRTDTNLIEALSRGASEGVTLAINVAGMLIAFVAMVAFVNYLLGFAGLSLEQLLGWLFQPLAFAIGIPWDEAGAVGRLLGEKLVLTEVVAYVRLGELLDSGRAVLSERSAVIASYALCGFANFASVGIQLGGIGAMAPDRRADLARLGLKAMLGGAIATMMTGTVAGIFLSGK